MCLSYASDENNGIAKRKTVHNFPASHNAAALPLSLVLESEHAFRGEAAVLAKGKRWGQVGASAVFTLLMPAAMDGVVAKADDLVMPYACSLDRGVVKLKPAAETRYPLFGARDEQPFSVCPTGGGDCTTLMVHRFTTECAGERVVWARIALAGPAAGVAIPSGLPHGYAPVSGFRGRLILPALAAFGTHSSKVASEALSPDGVVDRNGEVERAASSSSSPWRTMVRAELRPDASLPALRVGTIALALMALMLAACLVAAGRWRMLQRFEAVAFSARLQGLAAALDAACLRFSTSMAKVFATPATGQGPDATVLNGLAVALARLAETELLVSTLPRELLLREVLGGEVEQVRERLGTLEEEMPGIPAARAASLVRAAMRELDRISRIAHGAARDSGARGRETFAMPQSLQEAYQLLGINADAAPQVAKKLVDALRMSWHPDFARDEQDRSVREARMKQINAAWDLIKDRRAAA